MDASITGRRALDFFMGLVFAAVGVYVAGSGFAAYRDPALAMVDRSTNPGSTTIVVGSLLSVLGIAIAAAGFVGSGRRPFAVAAANIPMLLRTRRFFKGGVILMLIAVYFFVLWRIVPFWLSTFLFLAATMRIFRAGAWWKIVLITAIATALIYYVFAVLAYVPLPTDFIWQRAVRR